MRHGNQTKWNADIETIDEWLVRERKASAKVESPTCPYCDFTHEEWWEFSGLASDYDVTDYEIHCHSCSKEFLVDKETSVRFEGKPKP